jgi:hypothetical protein
MGLSIHLSSVFSMAHDRGPFANPVVPSGLCREFPLTTGCAESIQACAERNSLSTKPWILVVWCRRLAVSRGSLAMPQGGLAPPSLERDVALGGWPALAEE